MSFGLSGQPSKLIRIADSVREFAPDVNRGVISQIARLCTVRR